MTMQVIGAEAAAGQGVGAVLGEQESIDMPNLVSASAA